VKAAASPAVILGMCCSSSWRRHRGGDAGFVVLQGLDSPPKPKNALLARNE